MLHVLKLQAYAGRSHVPTPLGGHAKSALLVFDEGANIFDFGQERTSSSVAETVVCLVFTLSEIVTSDARAIRLIINRRSGLLG